MKEVDVIGSIKDLIESKGVTKKKVAERNGVSYSALSKALTNQEGVIKDNKLMEIREWLLKVNTNDI